MFAVEMPCCVMKGSFAARTAQDDRRGTRTCGHAGCTLTRHPALTDDPCDIVGGDRLADVGERGDLPLPVKNSPVPVCSLACTTGHGWTWSYQK